MDIWGTEMCWSQGKGDLPLKRCRASAKQHKNLLGLIESNFARKKFARSPLDHSYPGYEHWPSVLFPWTTANGLPHFFRFCWKKQFREQQLSITIQTQPSDMANLPKPGHTLQLHKARLGNYHRARPPVWGGAISHCYSAIVFSSAYQGRKLVVEHFKSQRAQCTGLYKQPWKQRLIQEFLLAGWTCLP